MPPKCSETTQEIDNPVTKQKELVDVETYRGPGCLLCPKCARQNGTCATLNFTAPGGAFDGSWVRNGFINVCACDDNHIGSTCQVQKVRQCLCFAYLPQVSRGPTQRWLTLRFARQNSTRPVRVERWRRTVRIVHRSARQRVSVRVRMRQWIHGTWLWRAPVCLFR